MDKKYFHNARLIYPTEIVDNSYVYVEGKQIISCGQGGINVSSDTLQIDVMGNYLSPGFIDLHVHGGGGHDFMDGTTEAFLKIAETHVQFGTTGMCPTTLTADRENLFSVLDAYANSLVLNKKGSTFLGMHLEGPYLAMSQRGAQDPKYIRNPDPKEYRSILAYSAHIVRWSAAPELPGALEFAKYLTSKNVLVALAHTDAIYEEVVEGFNHGFSLATHFYSAMSGITRKNAARYAGVIEAGYLIDEMDVEIIADGIHVPAPLLKLIYKIKGADHIALITDSMRAAAMPEGPSILGRKEDGLAVIVEDAVAKLPDRSAFAGSVATMDKLLRNYINLADVSLTEVIKMMSLTPARILKIEDTKGSISTNKDADLVILNNQLQVMMTIVEGDIKYQRKGIFNNE